MSKAIAFIAGSWCSYCAMVGDYDGAMTILVIYGILAIKKGTTAVNSRTQTKNLYRRKYNT